MGSLHEKGAPGAANGALLTNIVVAKNVILKVLYRIGIFVSLLLNDRQLGDLESCTTERREEARTRGFASPTFVSYAFVVIAIFPSENKPSILGCT
jgi:hypothetical protein